MLHLMYPVTFNLWPMPGVVNRKRSPISSCLICTNIRQDSGALWLKLICHLLFQTLGRVTEHLIYDILKAKNDVKARKSSLYKKVKCVWFDACECWGFTFTRVDNFDMMVDYYMGC